MADLEQRVDKLEEKVAEMEKEITSSLGDIKNDLVEIKSYVKGGDDLVNEKLKNHEEKIRNLEAIVSKIAWTIVLAVAGVIGEAIFFYIRTGGK